VDTLGLNRLAGVVVSVLAGAAASAATTAATAPSDTQLSEVVVTASKREEVVSALPIAISVVSQQDLDRTGTQDVTGLITQVPNLQLSGNGFAMRGLGSTNISDQAFSTVATHIDGVYEQRPEVLSQGLYDVARVEVLRGPQGTLYGRNATAGVVNIITNDPTHTAAGAVDASYGNYDELITRGMLNLPISDTLAIRGTAFAKSNNGYSNVTLPNGSKFDTTDSQAVRLTALWTPTDSFSWRLSVSRAINRGTVTAFIPAYYSTFPNADFAGGTSGAISAPVEANPNQYAYAANSNNANHNEETVVRSNMTWHLSKEVALVYTAGYSNFKNTGMLDSAPMIYFQQDNSVRAWSHELDAKFDLDKFSGLVGLYYYKEDQDNAALLHLYNTVAAPYNTLVGGSGDAPSVSTSVDLLSHSPNRFSKSKAIFTQGTFEATDNLKFIGGLRYTKDELGNVHQFLNVCAPGTATVITAAQDCGFSFFPGSFRLDIGGLNTSSDKLTWKFTTEYSLNKDAILYGTVSTGYRSGGVADRGAPAAAQIFKPETVTNYEVGAHTYWLDHSLSLNVTAFDMKYKDLQVTAIYNQPGALPTPVTLNAATADVKGLEVESAWRLTPVDTVSAFVTYLDAKYSSFANGYDTYASASGFNGAAQAAGYAAVPIVSSDFSGNSLPNAPKSTARISYSHDFDLGTAGHLTPAVSSYYQASSYTDASNRDVVSRKSFTKTDLTLDYTSSSGAYNVEAFVFNVENKRVVNASAIFTGLVLNSYQAPRLYGVRIGYKF
jgi:iron complex outermembrane receptor protein